MLAGWNEQMNKIIFGDCRDSMRALFAQGVKVQTCVTSPPYWGLRDYGVNGQLGLEATPAEYVSNMVEVFSLVWELLADDWTLWLNLGDSYAANRGYQVPSTKGGPKHGDSQAAGGKGATVPSGLKPKDLVGIPWMVAFALRADGWYLRQDIIWHKPSPMPESVRDRCTKAHEYMFLLSKRGRYYFNADAIQEESAGRTDFGSMNRIGRTNAGGEWKSPEPDERLTRNKRSVWTVASEPYSEGHFAVFPTALIEPCIMAGSRIGDIVFDPFIGSGTTAQVAEALGRRWLGCELNEAYGKLQKDRTAQMVMVL